MFGRPASRIVRDVQSEHVRPPGQITPEPIDDGLRRKRRASSIRVQEHDSRGSPPELRPRLVPRRNATPATPQIALGHDEPRADAKCRDRRGNAAERRRDQPAARDRDERRDEEGAAIDSGSNGHVPTIPPAVTLTPIRMMHGKNSSVLPRWRSKSPAF